MKVRKTISAFAAAAMLLTCAPNAAVLAATNDNAEPQPAAEQAVQTEQTAEQTVQSEQIAPEAQAAADLLPYQDESLSFEERAADLVARMTLEEKAAQTAAKSTPGISRLGVHNYYYWREGIHGVARQGGATSFPVSLAMSNTWDPELMQAAMDITSTEARGKNNRYDLNYWNPTINMARDPRWGRNEESYGEDPYLTAQIGGAAARGMEGTDEKYKKTITTLKHYAANNNEGERQTGTSIMNERTMREYYSRAFRDIVKDVDPGAVMSSYNGTTLYRNGEILSSMDGQKIDYIASSANSYLINDLLRRTYGFGGFVVGDCGAWDNAFGRAPLKQKLYPDMRIDDITAPMTVAKIVNAGSSLDCNSGGNGTAQVAAAVEQGLISEDALDVMVYELFLQRMKTGEFDNGAKYQDIKSSVVESDEHVAVSEQASEETWVLLENNGILPLKGSDNTSDTPYTITDASFDDSGKLNVSYSKLDNAPANAKIMAASYSAGDVMTSFDSGAADGSGNISLNVTKPDNSDGSTKVFVWDSEDNIKPLGNTYTLGKGSSGGPINVAVVGNLASEVVLGDYSADKESMKSPLISPIDGITDQIKAINPDSEVTLLGNVKDSTPLFSIKSITLVKSNGKTSSVDLSTAQDVRGMTKDGGEFKDITKSAMAYVPNVNFADVTEVRIEASSTPGMPNVTVSLGYGSASQPVASVPISATQSGEYATNSGVYNGATGGYTGTEKLYITVSASADFSVENYKTSLDAVDYIIAYGGTVESDSGESNDRKSIDLPSTQGHIQQLCDAYPDKTVVVLQSVGQVNVEGFKDKCAAMLWTSYNGQKQGEALGKVLTGEVAPSGKLSTTWYTAADLDKMPLGTSKTTIDGVDYNLTSYELSSDINNPEAEYPGRTYQYYSGTPVYPFGYGKGYTTFEYSNVKIDKASADANDIVTITANVKNTGSAAGTEVAQLYITVPGADGKTLPLKQLKGFERVTLNPGETKTATFSLDLSDVFFFDETKQQNYVIPGEYTAKVGGSSADAENNTVKFNVSGDIAETIDSVYAIPSGIKVYSVNNGADAANKVSANASVTLKNDKVITDLEANGITMSYKSSNTDVANVDANGNVTAGSKEGTATITVTASKANGGSAEYSFPIVSQYREGISAEKKAEYLARLDAAYNACPEIAYTPENYAELKGIYTDFRATLENALLDDGLEKALNETIAAIQAIPRIELTDEYTIGSVNSNIISDGEINYNSDGIGVINASETTISGTITDSTPAEIDMQALSGENKITSSLIWTIERLDASGRKAPEIDMNTGKVKLYTNGVYKITASDYPNKKFGSITVYANLQIEGENADDGAGAKLDDVKEGASNNGLNAGSTAARWLRFDGVKLDRLTGITFRVSNKDQTGKINVSLLPNSDWTIASVDSPVTGDWTKWQEVKADVNRYELNRQTLDENGCGSIYVQTNGANLDYMSFEYNKDTIDPVCIGNGEIAVNTSLSSGTMTLTAGGEQKGTEEITAPGKYTFGGFKDNDNVTITVGGETKSVTYKTPNMKDIYVYNFSDSIYDKFFTISGGMTTDNGLGMYCEGGWASAKGNSYKHDNGVTYSFTRALQGGRGQEGSLRVYFTPDSDGVVSAVFGASTTREMNITQDGKTVTKSGIGDNATSVQMNVKAGLPVYVYGGGSNKSLYGVLFEPGKTAAEVTPTPIPTATPTPEPLPDITYQNTVEFEDYIKEWHGRNDFGTKAAATGKVVQNTTNGDTFYYGEKDMKGLVAIDLMSGTESEDTVTIDVFAVDMTGTTVDDAKASMLTEQNKIGTVNIVKTKNWDTMASNIIRIKSGLSGTKGLFIKGATTGKYLGNFDCFTMLYSDAASGSSADGAALTAENDLAEISAQGSVVTSQVKSSGEVSTIDYNKEYGDDVTFEKLINWNGMVTALAQENNADASKLLTSAMGSVWINATPDSYAEKDEGAPSSPAINDIVSDGDQLYAGCDEGYMITMNPCSKCSTIKKVCDFDIKELGSDGEKLYLSGNGQNAEIAIADARQENIKADAAKELIAAGALPVDVRSAEEFAQDSIDGSLNVPVDEFAQWLGTQDKNETIIVYCASGNRAGKAAEIAKEQGFKNIYNAGSINDLK